MKGNVIYRVQVLYYEEFCGCFGDTVIFEKYYTTKDAANKKIKELNKQLRKGYFQITKDYTLHGEYRDDVTSMRVHFKTINDRHEAVLFREKPYHDLEFLHMSLEPEKIYVENNNVEETIEEEDDYDGRPIMEVEDGKYFVFAKPNCEPNIIANFFELELECEAENFMLYCGKEMYIIFNEDTIDVSLEDENNKELCEKVKEYFLNEGWKESQ